MKVALRTSLVALALGAITLGGCDYVVVPPEDGDSAAASSKGWTAVATSVGVAQTGGLQVTLAIRNETGAWSAMEAMPDRPATLVDGDGTNADCTTVVVGSGGHRLAPGMRMRGFSGGLTTAPTTELIRVECAGIDGIGTGARLAIDYRYVTGEYNYYEPDANQVSARLEVDLDHLAPDLTYPVAEPVEGVIVGPDVTITAINGVELTLEAVERTPIALQSTWKATNPGTYPSFVHIGDPPVIGSDGILYGVYESPDLATVPLTPANGEAEWTTEVDVPADVSGLYMMLSVESKKQRLFVNYAIDLTGG